MNKITDLLLKVIIIIIIIIMIINKHFNIIKSLYTDIGAKRSKSNLQS